MEKKKYIINPNNNRFIGPDDYIHDEDYFDEENDPIEQKKQKHKEMLKQKANDPETFFNYFAEIFDDEDLEKKKYNAGFSVQFLKDLKYSLFYFLELMPEETLEKYFEVENKIKFNTFMTSFLENIPDSYISKLKDPIFTLINDIIREISDENTRIDKMMKTETHKMIEQKWKRLNERAQRRKEEARKTSKQLKMRLNRKKKLEYMNASKFKKIKNDDEERTKKEKKEFQLEKKQEEVKNEKNQEEEDDVVKIEEKNPLEIAFSPEMIANILQKTEQFTVKEEQDGEVELVDGRNKRLKLE